MDSVLRFGDVVRGFILAKPEYSEPSILFKEEHYYRIDVDVPEYSVVLTPCCSIEGNIISLTPLVKVIANLLKNPYYAEDLTRINRLMNAEQSMLPEKWEST